MHARSFLTRIALAAAVLTLLAWALPAQARGSSCLWRATGGFSVNFPNLDPSNAISITLPVGAVSLQSNEAGDCQPTNNTMSFAASNGNNFSGGSRRMTNGTYFIPYSIDGLATLNRPGNNSYVVINFTVTIQGTAYQDVAAGNYTDSVTITLTP
jgi:spore coat protein U-like protein